jgi:hypothetical protein
MQGWSYVGDRLLSAVVPYEETGWYDGQMWVKPPEVCIHACIEFHGPVYKLPRIISWSKQNKSCQFIVQTSFNVCFFPP